MYIKDGIQIRMGDEFIIGSSGQIRYHKVVGLPGQGNLKSIKCSAHRKSLPRTTYSGKAITVTSTEFESDITKHNYFVYIKSDEISYRGVWLIKREDNG